MPSSMPAFASLDDRIRHHGLERVANSITASVRDCIRLKTKASREDDIALAASKFGGCPDLPPSVVWPTWRGAPLSFIAQINTHHLPLIDADPHLPQDTLLSVFYAAEEMPWGYEPGERDGWKIIASSLDSQFERRRLPDQLSKRARFPACQVVARKGMSLPEPNSEIIVNWGMTEEEDDAYLALYEAVMPPEDANHQLLGHPSEIQSSDMPLECELVSHGFSVGQGYAHTHPQAARLKAGASEWRLLAQLDSDDEAKMAWADGGRFYFWIRDSALRGSSMRSG